MSALLESHSQTNHGISWEQLPTLLTTREVADLLGKTTGNVRARASKGDFGPPQAGNDGLPRYDRERVRHLAERMAARQAQSRPAVPTPADSLPPALSALLAGLQAQQNEQIHFWKMRLEEAQAEATQAKQEAQELRCLLREREETTRETLTHMDTLHVENIAQVNALLESERKRWETERAALEAETERLAHELAAKKPTPALWRK
jgi:hypothetical protein